MGFVSRRVSVACSTWHVGEASGVKDRRAAQDVVQFSDQGVDGLLFVGQGIDEECGEQELVWG